MGMNADDFHLHLLSSRFLLKPNRRDISWALFLTKVIRYSIFFPFIGHILLEGISYQESVQFSGGMRRPFPELRWFEPALYGFLLGRFAGQLSFLIET